jgi:hypothetical protein
VGATRLVLEAGKLGWPQWEHRRVLSRKVTSADLPFGEETLRQGKDMLDHGGVVAQGAKAEGLSQRMWVL